MVPAVPFDACSPLENGEAVKGNVVLAKRGQCMFVGKAKNVEDAGGIAIIIAGEYHPYHR